jgi:N-acetylneuraminate epimerase
LKKCYGLDLSDTRKGWIEFDTWPGPERVCPVCAAYNGIFYMFSGETTQTDSADEIHRLILRDAYSFRPIKYKGKWRGLWKKLADMPEGVSAGGSPLPVFGEGEILFFGGVDAKTAMHNDPVSHAGISNDMQIYLINTDTWKYAGKNEDTIARVTLPIVPWEGGWAYISGEIKPGIRTNSICVIR